jgi:hypothetical protein
MVTAGVFRSMKSVGLVIAFSALVVACEPPQKIEVPVPAVQIAPVNFIAWEPDIQHATARSSQEDKLLFMYFYQPKNADCVAMTSSDGVLNQGEVVDEINEHMVPIRFNVDNDPWAKTLDLQPTKLPTIVLIAPTMTEGEIVGIASGYTTPKEYDQLMLSAIERWGALTPK